MPDYPALMIDTDGNYEAILPGHGHNEHTIGNAELAVIGPPPEGWRREVIEVFFHFVPRIKHCDRWDGWGCDMQGEWHGHWFEVQPTEDPTRQFTLIKHTDLPEEAA